MLTDYERAWADLTRFVLSKPNHGQAGLLTEMARLTDLHRVAEGSLPALLRLYGVEVQLADAPPNDDGDAIPGAVADVPHRSLTEESHAGDHKRQAARAAA
jgi:hypothetical protein